MDLLSFQLSPQRLNPISHRFEPRQCSAYLRVTPQSNEVSSDGDLPDGIRPEMAAIHARDGRFRANPIAPKKAGSQDPRWHICVKDSWRVILKPDSRHDPPCNRLALRKRNAVVSVHIR